ncbi:MAG TPA: diguanylate cyclase, partial [Gammaproteobacteria bacterium]|nr:diguanylate cyclase [Gammaproteobacteria bacterium]
ERHGERWGIAALKEILETVRLVTRRGDVCARIDVGKFLLFLPSITPQGTARVAEKLRIRIRHQRFHLPGEQTGELSASFATVHFVEDAQEMKELMRLLANRLDKAINSGGDQGCYGGE